MSDKQLLWKAVAAVAAVAAVGIAGYVVAAPADDDEDGARACV
jgi:hypothetical protein